MNHKSKIKNQKSLSIAWLYPELMSTYGDRGNIIVLQKICEWNNIDTELVRINQKTSNNTIDKCDIIFMGGAQDIQQEIVNKDLINHKGKKIIEKIESHTPSLFICGAYQFLGKYYLDIYGNKIKGLGVFDIYTESKPEQKRLTGSIIIKPKNIFSNTNDIDNYFVGFENHGGRTYLKDENQAFAKVISGYGNNGEDKTEGIHYKNSIGTYLHGPILACNPNLASYLIENAVLKKYGEEVKLKKLDGNLSEKAKHNILRRLKASY